MYVIRHYHIFTNGYAFFRIPCKISSRRKLNNAWTRCGNGQENWLLDFAETFVRLKKIVSQRKRVFLLGLTGTEETHSEVKRTGKASCSSDICNDLRASDDSHFLKYCTFLTASNSSYPQSLTSVSEGHTDLSAPPKFIRMSYNVETSRDSAPFHVTLEHRFSTPLHCCCRNHYCKYEYISFNENERRNPYIDSDARPFTIRKSCEKWGGVEKWMPVDITLPAWDLQVQKRKLEPNSERLLQRYYKVYLVTTMSKKRHSKTKFRLELAFMRNIYERGENVDNAPAVTIILDLLK